MTLIKYATSEPLSPDAIGVLKSAVKTVYSEHISLLPSEPGPGVLGFGVDSGVHTLSNKQITSYPDAYKYLALGFHTLKNGLAPNSLWGNRTLYLDTETHNAGRQWGMTPREFFRLGQYAWGPTGDVVLTTDYDEIIEVTRQAEGVVAHNGHAFDLSTLFGKESVEPLLMANEARVFDTMVYAALLLPAPARYPNREGVFMDGSKPENVLKWLSLDNLCFQLGVPGKVGDLKALAKRYNPKGTLVADLDYSLIPLDDPEFLDYARNDVTALQGLTSALLTLKWPEEYDWREQLSAAIDAQNTRNGIQVDIPVAQARVDTLTARKDALLSDLVRDYGFPTEGKMPWRSTAGKEAVMKALADLGITPVTRPDWTKTDTGNPSLGGKVLLELTRGTSNEAFGEALAELMGQRSLASLALSSVQPDGKAHPDITALQRSGRKSTTKPGLTVWSSHDEYDDEGNISNEKSLEKAYFIPDTPDERMIAFDYSNADQRVLAALSGDVDYAMRFDEGADGHEINGRIMFGDELYDSDPKFYRNAAKAPGHAYTYGGQPDKLSAVTGLPLEDTTRFVEGMKAKYPDLTKWQNRVRRAARVGFVVNAWGRRMAVERGHEFTQAPALHGQSGTRELMVDALIRMLRYDIRLVTWVKAQIHDELLFSIPVSELEWAVPKIAELMDVIWEPSDGTGQPVPFPVSHGEPAINWQQANHG